MTLEERFAYVKRLHELGIATVAEHPTEEMFRAVAEHEHVLANTPNPGPAWVREDARRARALLERGLDLQGRPKVCPVCGEPAVGEEHGPNWCGDNTWSVAVADESPHHESAAPDARALSSALAKARACVDNLDEAARVAASAEVPRERYLMAAQRVEEAVFNLEMALVRFREGVPAPDKVGPLR